MRISDAYSRLGNTGVRTDKATEAKGRKDASGAGTAAAPNPASGDATKVALSPRAVALARASDVSQNPRVAELREQVRSGKLEIDARKIASALLGGEE